MGDYQSPCSDAIQTFPCPFNKAWTLRMPANREIQSGQSYSDTSNRPDLGLVLFIWDFADLCTGQLWTDNDKELIMFV